MAKPNEPASVVKKACPMLAALEVASISDFGTLRLMMVLRAVYEAR